MTLPTRDDLLTPAQVAEAFAVDPKTVTRWADTGKLAAFTTPGGHRRYWRSQIESLIPAAPTTDAGGPQ